VILDQKNLCPEYGRKFKSRGGKSNPPPINRGLSMFDMPDANSDQDPNVCGLKMP